MTKDSNDQTNPSEEQILAIRNHFHQTAFAKFTDLVNYLQSLPLAQDEIKAGVNHLITGMLWVKEALLFAALIKNPVKLDAEPEASEEKCEEEHEKLEEVHVEKLEEVVEVKEKKEKHHEKVECTDKE